MRPELKKSKAVPLIIWGVSLLVFSTVVALDRIAITPPSGFDPHIFATLNACINGAVALLLLWGLLMVRRKAYGMHRNTMLAAIALSVVFLVSYVLHHLFTGSTRYGGTGLARYIYFTILITHIVLASVVLPFILFTAYRGLSADFVRHRRLARITYPIWLYVAVSGVVVYLMIYPYY